MGGGGPESPGACAYSVSKIAIRAMTEFVAAEERDFNIVAVAIRPGAQIATEEAPEEARARMPGPEYVGNRFVLAAEAPMELTGKLLDIDNGTLVVSAR
jgi:NAD(P)-dependent dehydrogenase (short-subunit alcohol dehydrogenase family)